MAKETEIKVQLIVRRKSAKTDLTFDDILNTTGTTRLVKCNIVETRIIDIGVIRQPERAQKQRVVNQYKKIILEAVGDDYIIKCKLGNMNVASNMTIFKKSDNKPNRNPYLKFDIEDGNIVHEATTFCISDPDVFNKLKKFIEFAFTIKRRGRNARIVSDKTAYYNKYCDHSSSSSIHKAILIELFDDIIKLTAIGGTTTSIRVGDVITEELITNLFESVEQFSCSWNELLEIIKKRLNEGQP